MCERNSVSDAELPALEEAAVWDLERVLLLDGLCERVPVRRGVGGACCAADPMYA